jgi:hypothetical protein
VLHVLLHTREWNQQPVVVQQFGDLTVAKYGEVLASD